MTNSEQYVVARGRTVQISANIDGVNIAETKRPGDTVNAEQIGSADDVTLLIERGFIHLPGQAPAINVATPGNNPAGIGHQGRGMIQGPEW